MAIAKFKVRMLSGELQNFNVDPDTPISEIRAQLNENTPRFHETRLYLGDTELSSGSVAQANIAPDAEVQAVTTALIDETVLSAARLAENLNSHIDLLYKQAGFIESKFHNSANEMIPALKFLDQHKDDLSKDHFDKLKEPWILLMDDFFTIRNFNLSEHFKDLFHRWHMLVMYLFAKLGDAIDLLNLKAKQAGYTRDALGRHEMVSKREAMSSAMKEIEARISKPPEKEPSQVNSHGQGHPTQQVSNELEEAVRASVAEAYAREGADVQEAVLRSKIDAIQKQQLVVVRLTKRNAHVLDALLTDPHLQKVQAQVEQAGCEILPPWANGGIVLAPLTEQQALEADVQLCAHHIVVSQQDQAHMEKVLADIPKRRRPGIKLADAEHLNASSAASTTQALDHVESPNTKPQLYIPEIDIWDGFWQVERTFVHCPLPRAGSESPRGAQSEPWGAAENSRPLKLPRLSPK